MNIRIGDIVRFISEKMEGKVTGIIDNTTVNIFVDDYGFEIPASTSDLVVIHSDFTPSKPDSSSVTQVQKGVTMESGDTLYFAIVPDNFNNLPDPAMNYFWLTIHSKLVSIRSLFAMGKNIAVSVPVIVIRTALVR